MTAHHAPDTDGGAERASRGTGAGAQHVPPDIHVDALGKPCPQPVIDLARAVREAPVGAIVALTADDPAAGVDVPVWCRMQRQRLVGRTSDGAVLEFRVQKVRELA